MDPTADDFDRKGQDEAKRQQRPHARRNFYGRKAATAAEAIELDEAGEIEGLADEIALLTVRLRAAANNDDADLALICKGAEMLVKAVGMQYRLSPRATKDLAQRFAAVLNAVGDQILPPRTGSQATPGQPYLIRLAPKMPNRSYQGERCGPGLRR